MMGILAAYHNLPFQDITFKNFEHGGISIKDILPLANDH
jgi:hypothetical protein